MADTMYLLLMVIIGAHTICKSVEFAEKCVSNECELCMFDLKIKTAGSVAFPAIADNLLRSNRISRWQTEK